MTRTNIGGKGNQECWISSAFRVPISIEWRCTKDRYPNLVTRCPGQKEAFGDLKHIENIKSSWSC